MIKSQGVAVALVALLAGSAAPAPGQDGPIQDNSFLIEEAYNQGPGIVQRISTFLNAGEGEGWAFGFTQEWPAPNQRHQLSYTVIAAEVGDERGFGDFADGLLVVLHKRLLGQHPLGEEVLEPALDHLLQHRRTGSRSVHASERT